MTKPTMMLLMVILFAGAAWSLWELGRQGSAKAAKLHHEEEPIRERQGVASAALLPSSSSSIDRTAETQLRAQLQRLSERLEELSNQPSAAASAEPAPWEEVPAPSTAREDYERSREHLAQLDQALDEQRVDPAWASGAESELRDVLKPLLDGTAGVHTTCRETLCRSEITHGDDEGHARLVARALEHFAWPGAAQISAGSEGGGSTVVFFAKPGHELPLSDQ